MASKEKVQEFLKESNSHKHYAQIVDLAVTYLITKAEKEGNTSFAGDLRNAKKAYEKDLSEAIDITESVYQEMFSDDELDNLIILFSNPALSKARDTAPEIVGQILEKYSLVNK